MEIPVASNRWIEENRRFFAPPIGNKLMYKGDLSVMFVGGPNGRRDFHIDESAEFFFQITGNMELPIIENERKRIVKIRQGDVFLLPSRVPHSPQRPEQGSVGLVIERARADGIEYDCLRWYTDFDKCEEIEYEAYFACKDLGKDLLPAIQEYKDFKQNDNEYNRPSILPIVENDSVITPEPFNLQAFVEKNKLKLQNGLHVPLFKNHPETEFNVFLSSKQRELVTSLTCEVFVFQVQGTSVFTGGSGKHTLGPSACFVLKQGTKWMAERKHDPNTELIESVTLVMYINPSANKSA